jgi:hypothetical protein
LRALVKDDNERGKPDLTECFIDGTFVIAKKEKEGFHSIFPEFILLEAGI